MLSLRVQPFVGIACIALAVSACSGGGGTPGSAPATQAAAPSSSPSPRASVGVTATPTAFASTTPTSLASATPSPAATVAGLPQQLQIFYPMFYGNIIASFASINPGYPRQLVALPNGDLLIGTGSPFVSNNQVYILPNADGPAAAGKISIFATLKDGFCGDDRSLKENAQGLAFAPAAGGGTIFVGMECGVFAIPYETGDQAARPASQILAVRQGPITNLATDGDVHHTTSVAVSGSNLYIGVGSSCNACAEADPTRAVVLRTNFSGGNQVTIAKRFRNPIALAVSPSGTVWAGGAGQDCAITTGVIAPATPPPTCASMDQAYLSDGHPFEFMDPVSERFASNGNTAADYFWPECEENRWAVFPGSCASMVTHLVQAPAYETIVGATFYPIYGSAAPMYAFPAAYRGALFYTLHGSWHEDNTGVTVAPPRVVYVPMNGDQPKNPQTWGPAGQPGGDPYSTWGTSGGNPAAFIDGFQDNTGARVGRPAGIAVGPNGSLFFSDDLNGNIYRIRYGAPPVSSRRVRKTSASRG